MQTAFKYHTSKRRRSMRWRFGLQDVKGSQIKATYNAIGQRVSVNDPNQGISSFTYNALGEVLTQTDARAITSTTTYDKLGRKTQFTVTADENGDGVNDAIVDTWAYDPTGAKGQLSQSKRTIAGVIERQENNTFDALIRPSSVVAVQNTGSGTTRSYSSEFQYDSYYGRVLAQFFPNGEGEQFIFNQYGYETQQRNATNASIYRQIVTVDAAGRPTRELKGFNLSTDTAYWPNGQTKDITHQKDGVTIRKIHYAYDVFGNVATQELNNGMAGNTLESFSYDKLHRLTTSTRTGAASATVNYGYDAAGNFNFKSDFSLASGTPYNLSTGGLGGGGANAVKSVSLKAGGTRSYGYDASGNMTSDNASFSAKYDHANLATKLQRGAVINYFIYGANNEKARQTGTDGSKVYLGGYEDWITAGQTKVSLGNYAQVTNGTGGRVLNYFLTDRLGSVDAVTDGNGVLVETRGYDAFGAPRTGTWGDATQLASTAITPKGFTSHEHLNSVQLIHMNGRMYDYQLGRFLGVDPFIQMPTNSQSLNPYSYIMNNPLSGTDPTGYENSKTDGDCESGPACKGGKVQDQTVQTGTHIAGYTPAILVTDLKSYDKSKAGNSNGAPGQNSKPADKGPLTFFKVQSVPGDHPKIIGEVGSDKIEGRAYLNGIVGDKQRHADLGYVHLGAEFEDISTYILINNPSRNFFRDAWETFRDKIGWTTPAAKQLAQVLIGAQSDGRKLDIVAHSQGGAMLAEAIRYANKHSDISLSNIRACFHGGANNVSVTNGILARADVRLFGGINGSGYRNNPVDLVPQLIGFNGVYNPYKFFGSIINAPRLFMGSSPHTPPYIPTE